MKRKADVATCSVRFGSFNVLSGGPMVDEDRNTLHFVVIPQRWTESFLILILAVAPNYGRAKRNTRRMGRRHFDHLTIDAPGRCAYAPSSVRTYT